MLTKNLSTLKINRLTQEQYDREKASGTLDDTALYFTPEEEIIVPTSLSQLSDDETHRLVTDTDKNTWNSKAEVFTIIFSYDENGNPIINKTFDEIASAFNSGKTLRLLAGEMFEGELVYHTSNQFSFIFVWIRTIVTILPSQVIEEDADMYLPSANTSDAGKMLTVDNSGNAAWTKAPSSGAEVFNVAFTQASGSTPDSMSFTSDKTYAEIVAAHEAGKIVVCSVLGNYFGQLAEVTNNFVIFGADSLSNGPMSSKFVLTIYSDNEVNLSFLNFYSPRFLQEVISAAAWSGGVYSFESAFPNANFDIEIELDSTATESQVEAWSNAKPTAVFGTNTMKALGDVPTVDIPVIIKVVFNPNKKSSSGQQ